ncbi:G5 domain-containing protein, partial [Patescibacteria group bacterium]|nr:G5 domain-containing protein [Patescibacteria group bacterium]
LTFNFYGTSDGRQVEITQPNIFNITSPPAPEYIYTSGLASGQKVQVDSAHYGADSIFYRYITYANGETKEEEVFSRYQAWPAKFKVGEGEVDEGGEDDGKVDEVIIDDEDAGLPDVDGEEDVSQVVG